MSRVRTVVLVLLLAVIVVAFGAGLAARREGDGPPVRDEQAAREYRPPDLLRRLGRLVAPLAPRLRLEPRRIAIGAAPVTTRVPPADDPFRTATFRRVEGGPVRIVYEAAADEANPFRRQEWPGDGDDPARGTLLILGGGGTLRFTCAGPHPCVVELE